MSRAWRGRLIGIASIAAGAYEYARPERWAAMADVQPELIQALGIRDVGSGVALVIARDVRAPLVARVVFDVGDGLMFARRNRVLGIAAGAFAALGAATLLRR